MNRFGNQFSISLYGESHGEAVGVIIDGCPAGLSLSAQDFAADLDRRRGGRFGTTARKEADSPRFGAGLYRGRTTGAPIQIEFANMAQRSEDYRDLEATPRPGHADLTARIKYGGYNDPRGGGMFSGRMTAPLVAAGCVAKKLIAPVHVNADLVEIGGERDMDVAVKKAKQTGDSLGGLIEAVARKVPAGLGEPFFDGLESTLAHLLFSIPGVKGLEFGDGFRLAAMRGSESNDEILDRKGKTATNHAGGLYGGISGGQNLRLRLAVKPSSSIGLPQQTINLDTGKSVPLMVTGRHDVCIALRFPPIVEAAIAIVLADAMLCAGRLPRVLKEGKR